MRSLLASMAALNLAIAFLLLGVPSGSGVRKTEAWAQKETELVNSGQLILRPNDPNYAPSVQGHYTVNWWLQRQLAPDIVGITVSGGQIAAAYLVLQAIVLALLAWRSQPSQRGMLAQKSVTAA